jgi:hypothetical protein
MKAIHLFIVCMMLGASNASAQTLGGQSTFNFLKLPASPILTASGGVNVSYKTNDVGLSINNPALLDAALHGQVNLSFNGFLGGVKTYSTSGALHHEKSNTTLGAHIYFLDYGSIPQTDAAGNSSGTFRPVDFVVQVSAGRQYLQNWRYGLSMKFIQSSYQQYSSNAIAFDVGVLYQDSSNQFAASLAAKNMGFQLKTYNGDPEELPFDLQAGFTKRLAKSPFGFSVTAQHLQRFDILYNDTVYNASNELESSNGFVEKLVNHFVIATHVYLGSQLEATLGYNLLRRRELNMGPGGNGLNGFSMGLRVKFQKLQVQYARSYYQSGVANNQLGLNLQLNKMFGLGD